MANHTKQLLYVVLIGTIVAIALSFGTYVALNQTTDAINSARGAEYRICLRQMVTRAVMDTDKHGDEKQLPIYDCTPNLHGRVAVRMEGLQAQLFRNYVQTTPEDQLP